ncbi:hypothetical protein [Helicobacter pylori]|uniref:hypothetical protein n=1 Tax=Helicobacter pylori TaxID=210 RepID=UPI00165B03C1|nr:hypothetical protein [Helicobacter pylori]
MLLCKKACNSCVIFFKNSIWGRVSDCPHSALSPPLYRRLSIVAFLYFLQRF